MPRVPIFDHTTYTNKPDGGEVLSQNSYLYAVAPNLRGMCYTGVNHLVDGEYNKAAAQAWAASIGENTGLTVLDTEPWQTLDKRIYPRKTIVAGVEGMNAVMKDIKAVNKRLLVGHYSGIIRDWIQVTANLPSRTAGWKAALAYTRRRVAWYTPPFTKHVDFICPDAYLVLPEGTVAQQKAWTSQWIALSAPEWAKFHKPIYPYIWAEYHGGSGRDYGTPLDLEVWDHLLKEITEVCDGLVVWGGAKFNAEGTYLGVWDWYDYFHQHYAILNRYALPRGQTA